MFYLLICKFSVQKTSIFFKKQISYTFRLFSGLTMQGLTMAALFLDPLSCFIFIPFLSLPDNTDEMNKFELTSAYRPTGDQPEAIRELVEGFREGNQCETLLGVTGSGKTFTMANVIAQLNKPTLIIAHNKTLAAQLYGEFKEFFPENAVEYFVS